MHGNLGAVGASSNRMEFGFSRVQGLRPQSLVTLLPAAEHQMEKNMVNGMDRGFI